MVVVAGVAAAEPAALAVDGRPGRRRPSGGWRAGRVRAAGPTCGLYQAAVCLQSASLRSLGLTALLLVGCACPPRQPVPVTGVVPSSAAFAVCVHELALGYGRLELVDAEGFRLQTAWCPAAGAGERRATVFIEAGTIQVVVEARRLAEPVFGMPTWGAVELDGWAAAELAQRMAIAASATRR